MKIENMTLQEYLDSVGIEELNSMEINIIQTFIDLKLRSLEAKLLNPILTVDNGNLNSNPFECWAHKL